MHSTRRWGVTEVGLAVNLHRCFAVLQFFLGRVSTDERREGRPWTGFWFFRENPFPSFLCFLLSGRNRIKKESSSFWKLGFGMCGLFSQNSLVFHFHMLALMVIPFAGCLRIKGQRGKMLNLWIWWPLGGASTQITSKISGNGEGKETLLWPNGLGPGRLPWMLGHTFLLQVGEAFQGGRISRKFSKDLSQTWIVTH